jgi:triosephosphate isomerase
MDVPKTEAVYRSQLEDVQNGPRGAGFHAGVHPLVKAVDDAEIVIAPAFTALRAVSDAARGTNLAVSSQDVFYEEKGAFTGEVSPGMVKDSGAGFSIVGHSERRQFFHETDQTVNLKTKAALNAGLGVILCVGETLEERKAGKTEEVLGRQLTGGLKDITGAGAANIVLAYEPVWAIGTGLTATPEQAEEAHSFIRKKLAGLIGEPAAGAMRLLYGGSVKPDNIDSLMACPDVDGALVGGAGLEAGSFAKIVNFKRGVLKKT